MKYYVESYGCTMNYGEGRRLSREMASMGYSEVSCAEDADIVILNTCTVVETTEKKMLARISELKSMKKEVIVTGCMAQVQPKRIEIRLPDSIVLPPSDYHQFAQTVLDRYGVAGPALPIIQGTDAILPIAQGCLGHCTYCITKFARGKLLSYDPKTLIRDFGSFVNEGAKEILVTAQDTACYGFDIDTDLPTLLNSMLRTEGDYRVRIGMMNPNHLKKIVDGLIDCMDDERVYKFLHIPVQSGSNTVLKNMNRGYTVESFLELVDVLRESIPEISIATDIIVGFPGETNEDYELTESLVRTLHADTLNITRFSSRPGTKAASMEQIHGQVAKRRSTDLTNLKNEVEYEVNKRLIGSRFRALATEVGKEGTIVRTEYYRPVVIKEDIPLGTFVDVEITDCRSTYLFGQRL